MKRNKLFLLGLFVVFAAVLSLSLVSSTFARYTTSNNATDSARVAKWGVDVTTTSYAMFAETYAKTEATTFDNTVESTEKVVAPGTNGTLSSINLEGTPEVAVKVTFVAELTLTNWEVDSDVYCPLVFTVNGTEYKIDATNTTTALLEVAVEEAIAGYTAEYEAGTDLSGAADDIAVSWAWAIGDGSTDVKDTALGDAAADGNAATVSLKITCTVTQID